MLRNVAIHERRKLSNRWLPDVHVVLRQSGGEGSPVCVLAREDGKGGERTLHRNLLLNCDCFPLPEAPTYRAKPHRKTPRQRTQLSATEDPPSRPNWESTDSESTDEPIYANPHNERHEASLECREGSSDEDLPLARLRQYGPRLLTRADQTIAAVVTGSAPLARVGELSRLTSYNIICRADQHGNTSFA